MRTCGAPSGTQDHSFEAARTASSSHCGRLGPGAADGANEAGVGWHVGLFAPLGTVELGPLPSPSVGVAAGLGLHLDAWTLFALGQWTRPQQISGTAPSYSREALAARVEGKVLVRCVIQTSGEVKDCQVLKGVPMLTDVVLASLRTSRFSPVIYRGLPQAIQYLFTFNFKLP